MTLLHLFGLPAKFGVSWLLFWSITYGLQLVFWLSSFRCFCLPTNGNIFSVDITAGLYVFLPYWLPLPLLHYDIQSLSAMQAISSFMTLCFVANSLTVLALPPIQLRILRFFSWGGVLDVLSAAANLWLPLVPSTQAPIRSGSWPPHDLTIFGFSGCLRSRALQPGGGLYPHRAYGV